MWRLTTLLAFIYLVFSLGIYHTSKKREQEIYSRHSAILKTTYATTIHLYRTYSETLYEEVIDRPEVLQLIDELYTAAPDRQAVLRGRLYRLLYPAYNRLVKRNLRQLHFQFPDNSSCLRFHRLEKYGDSLTNIRESIRLVNAHHKPVFGFENGRIYCGFRNVFPLKYREKHIGSVETSVSFKAIRKSMQDAAPDHDFLFIQKTDMIMAKAFPSELGIYTSVEIAPGYVVEDLRMLGLDVEDPLFPLAHRLNPILGSSLQVQKDIQKGVTFATQLKDQGKNYLVTGVPIPNIKGEQVAYIISYKENDEITTLWITFGYLMLGQTFLLFSLAFFIWKKQEAVNHLSRSESRFRAITRHMGDALYVTNAEGKIILSNHSMAQHIGYSLEELHDQDAHSLFHRHKEQGKLEVHKNCLLLQKNMEGKLFESSEDFFQRKDGTIIPVEIKGTPILLEHGQQGSVVLFRDISDRLQTEAERIKVKKLEAIGVLAGGIAHDFNNLMTVIMANIELAAMMISPVKPDAAKLLNEAKVAAQQTTKLTSRLLIFSKGRTPVTSVVNLATFLPDIINFILSGSKVSHTLETDEDLWLVQIDTNQISQAMENLLMNSMEAMDHNGTVNITCSNYNGTEDLDSPLLQGRYVRITIEDSGTGIAPKHLDKIFDPYFTTKKMGSTKGNGLGLSIVHSIIERHRGHIEVESTEGVGTLFSIYLPAVDEGQNET